MVTIDGEVVELFPRRRESGLLTISDLVIRAITIGGTAVGCERLRIRIPQLLGNLREVESQFQHYVRIQI